MSKFSFLGCLEVLNLMVGEAQQQHNKQKLDIEQEIRVSLAPARADVGLR